MTRQSLLALAGWLAAAVIAVAVGVTAVTLLGSGITSDPVEPLSQESAQQELDARAAAAAKSPSPSGTPSAEPSPEPSTSPPDGAQTNPEAANGGATRILQSKAGSAAAYCAEGRAVLSWWTPAQGYTVDDYEAGPGHEVSVEFERGDEEEDVDMKIECVKDVPRLRKESARDAQD